MIGRRSSYEIVIDNAAVSETHARIFSKGDDFYIEDLGSTNGTFVNKKRVRSKRLQDEDVITGGKHELILDISESVRSSRLEAPESSGQIASRAKTSALATADYREIMEKNIYDPNRATLLILRFKGKQIRKYVLKSDKVLTVGRLEDNHIVIENDAVSGHHAQIVSRDKEYFVEDLDSTNGTFVNEKPVNTHRLKDEDIVTIGKHELVFCEYEPYTMEETMLPNTLGQAYSTPRTTALDISNFKKTLDQSGKKRK